jgi:hypothetical protein
MIQIGPKAVMEFDGVIIMTSLPCMSFREPTRTDLDSKDILNVSPN